jgi:opacity protein-like surface antigen
VRIARLVLGALAILGALAAPAGAFDADQTFARNTFVLSGETAYGHQFNPENFSQTSDVQFVDVGLRFGWLPFDPVGPGPLHGSLEAGLEPIYQQYFEPKVEYFAGLAAVLRYHFLALGRFVPYLEVAGAAGGTNLKVPEIDSSFSFLLWAGVGASFFVTDQAAVYAGYRWTHLSNGGTSSPNRGIEAHTAVVGVSWFFK